MMNKLLPRARTTEIIEQEAGDELMIYDLRTDKAYTLNETSRNVYRACDGEMTFEDLRSRYNYTDDLIHFALGEIKASNLIESEVADHFAGLSRRDVIKKVGLGTMVTLPVIAAIVAPAAATAASLTACQRANCRDRDVNCNNGSPCSALRADFVCCFLSNTCSCAPSSVCLQNGGAVCP